MVFPAQDDEIEALWRGLHERGFCCHRDGRRGGREGPPDRRGDGVSLGGVAGSGGGFHDSGHEEEGESRGGVDAVLHSIAYAPPEAMQAGSFLKVRAARRLQVGGDGALMVLGRGLPELGRRSERIGGVLERSSGSVCSEGPSSTVQCVSMLSLKGWGLSDVEPRER